MLPRQRKKAAKKYYHLICDVDRVATFGKP